MEKTHNNSIPPWGGDIPGLRMFLNVHQQTG